MTALFGWVAAALACGLWLGERGRRLDAQRREGVLPVGRVRPAIVTEPASSIGGEAGVSQTMREEMREARDRYIDEAVREGFSPKAAAEDWDAMNTAAQTGVAG